MMINLKERLFASLSILPELSFPLQIRQVCTLDNYLRQVCTLENYLKQVCTFDNYLSVPKLLYSTSGMKEQRFYH